MISINKNTNQRINAFAAYTDESGVRYPTVPSSIIEWVEPPTPPVDYITNPRNYIVTEQDDAPYVAYTLKSNQQISDARWSEIKALRENKTQTGGYLVNGNWFHSDTFSRTQQLGLVMMGASIPSGLMWKTMGGTFVQMTPTLAQQIFAAAAQQDAAIFSHAEVLKSDLQADINVGWPTTWQDTQPQSWLA